jgi:hypothetical protein
MNKVREILGKEYRDIRIGIDGGPTNRRSVALVGMGCL